MTDEEYGRAWAELTGLIGPMTVGNRPTEYWHWVKKQVGGFGLVCILPAPVAAVYQHQEPFDEASAYAALGRAVREVHRLVPPLPT